MELNKVLASRRSIRKFISNKEIKQETIYKIIESARICQSAKNRQPWLFKILTREEKDIVAKMMVDYCKDNEGKIQKGCTCRYTAESIVDASVMILILKVKDDEYMLTDTLSIGAAIENMCLEATDLGLGTLWVCDTDYIKDSIIKLINKPNIELELISSLLIGYSDEDPLPRPRKGFNEILI